MRLAKGQKLEDWQEYCYVDILKYETPWRIPAKVAGLQQASSQFVTCIPLSEALDNMLLYVEDQKREKQPQDFEGPKLLLSRLPPTPRLLPSSSWKNQGTSMCWCVTHSQCARSRALYCTFFLRRRQHSSIGGTSSPWHTTAAWTR